MSHSSRGAAFERRVKKILEGKGWYVTRAAGSHGCADLIAICPDEVAFVQAKLGGPGAMPPAEWNELYVTAIRHGGVPILAHPPKRGVVEFLRVIGEKPVRPVVGGYRPPAPVDEWRPSDHGEPIEAAA